MSVLAVVPLAAQQTRIGIRGSQFTINGKITYTAEQGFPASTLR